MVFNVSTESGRSAMPRCTCATSSGDIFRIMRSAPSTRSGRVSRVRPAEKAWNHALEKRFRAAFENVVRRLQASGAGFGGIGRRLGIEETESRDAARDACARIRTEHIHRWKRPPAERVRSWHRPSRARYRRHASPSWPGHRPRRNLRARADQGERRDNAWPEPRATGSQNS